MLGNFSITDIITIAVITLLAISVIITIIIAMSKNNKNESVLDKHEEIKEESVEEEPVVQRRGERPIPTPIVPAVKEPVAKIEAPVKEETPVKTEVPVRQERPKPSLSELERKMAGEKTETREVKNNDVMKSALSAMQKDLVQKKQDPIQSFEHEQEEKAVISYQELVKRKSQTTNDNQLISKPEVSRVERNETPPEQKKVVYDEHELERTLNIQPISQQIKKNDEFLKALKDFRKNL